NNTWQLHWWILSLGDSLVVQEPSQLRQQMGDTLRRAAAAYGHEEGKAGLV
ncbi:TPA: WYL domain-containing protein, partial [Pseudomonas aeruginosa]|nr:WYL domain-containing protein [Pseudomonas aeruginosa]